MFVSQVLTAEMSHPLSVRGLNLLNIAKDNYTRFLAVFIRKHNSGCNIFAFLDMTFGYKHSFCSHYGEVG